MDVSQHPSEAVGVGGELEYFVGQVDSADDCCRVHHRRGVVVERCEGALGTVRLCCVKKLA